MSDATNLKIGPVRASFPHLYEPKAPKGSDKAQYSIMGVFDPKTKDGKRILSTIEDAIAAAEKEGATKLEGTNRKKWRMCLKEGSDEFPGDKYFDGKMILQCNNTKQPEVVDKKLQPITDEDEVYPGMWVYLHVNFFAYNKGGGVGIACSLQNVMKVKDDDRLDNKVAAAVAFQGVTFTDDDEDEDDDPKPKKNTASKYE